MDLNVQQPTMKISNSQLLTVMKVAAIFVAFYFGLTRIDAYIREKGIDNCARISSYKTTVTADNAVVSYPVSDVYSQCLKDKGISLD